MDIRRIADSRQRMTARVIFMEMAARSMANGNVCSTTIGHLQLSM
jgi:hypothetical protein